MVFQWVRRRLSSDGGFSLVEVAVASGTVLVSLSVLAGVVTAGLTATGYSRERQSASQLANLALEEIRSLPYLTVQAGLQGAATGDDLITHPDAAINNVGCGSSYCYGGERVVMHTGGANVDPLVPHVKVQVVGPTTYTISTYITNYQNDATTGAYRATVIVSWASAVKHSTSNVQAQTILFATNPNRTVGNPGTPPPGCSGPCTPPPTIGSCGTAPSTHPFPGPSLACFTLTAHQSASSASVTGTVGGVGLDHATLFSGRTLSDALIEQVSHVEGTAQAAGATVQVTGGDEQLIGRNAVSSRADNDPSLASSPVYDTQTLSSSAQSLPVSLGSYTLTASTTGGESGSTTSTTSACASGCVDPSTPTPRLCPNINGVANETDLLHCGGSTQASSAALSAQLALGGTFGSVTLDAITAQLTPSTAIVDRKNVGGGATCTTVPTPSDGCVRAAVTRAAADLSAGALPTGLNVLLKPVGFTYFAQITGLSDSVAAEAGPGAGAPSATQATGTVRVYCAAAIVGHLLCPVTGYVTKTLNEITSSVTTPTLTITDPALGGAVITMNATVTPGSTATSASGSPQSSATASSTPLSVSVAYKIMVGETAIFDTTIVLDPGVLTSSASYAPAP